MRSVSNSGPDNNRMTLTADLNLKDPQPRPGKARVAIKIEGLYKSFGRQEVIRGVSLEISQGETFVIIGGSGCGKSVLLRHMVGLHHPDRGRVVVLGVDITKSTERQLLPLRKRISMVFQGSALFNSMTVEQNVGLALREHRMHDEATIHQIVMEKLDLVNMTEHATKLPENLSGGMRKRVALARALAIDPEIMLYDEPTSELDPFFAQTIDNLVLDLQKRLRKTAVVVTHDMAHAFKIADRIGMLHDGKLIFIGTKKEIQALDHPVITPFIRRDGMGIQSNSTNPVDDQQDDQDVLSSHLPFGDRPGKPGQKSATTSRLAGAQEER